MTRKILRLLYICSKSLEMASVAKTVDEAQRALLSADCICLDVDSTVIMEEGVDELAAFCGVADEVSQLTSKAMSGSMTFQEALRQRLDIIKPTLSAINTFVKERPPTLTPGVDEFVKTVRGFSVNVYLVSGGFFHLIRPLADKLDIPYGNVYANRMVFEEDGTFRDFDREQPTSRSHGKAVVAERLKKVHSTVVFIGDGATDMEASPPADAFIGFGGNKVREAVLKQAPWFVRSFDELTQFYLQGKSAQ